MKVPFFDINRVHQPFQDDLENALLVSFRKGNFINGNDVLEFEKTCSLFLNINHAISCANGTDALSIAIASLELNIDTEVIIPSFNYVSSVESVTTLGLTPVFCDVDLESNNTCLKLIKKKISNKTKLIIVTHLFGLPVEEIEEISNFCKANEIHLIEDVAQSFGSSKNGKMCGTFGDIGITSFFPTKNLGCAGDGGMIFTNNEDLGTRIKMLKSHGQINKYEFHIPGYNSRLDTIQAAILNLKIEHFESDMNKRKATSIQYLLHLGKCELITLPPFKNNTFNQFTIRVKNNLRDKLKDFLSQKAIQTMIYYPKPMHSQNAYKHFSKDKLSNSTELSETSLSLPIFPGLTSEEISYICSSILEFEKSFE